MLNNIKGFFTSALLSSDKEEKLNAPGIEYATAALFVELAKADFSTDPSEKTLIFELLQRTFNLDHITLGRLVNQAEYASSEANDLYQFTLLVNQYLDNKNKILLLENFWRLAYADGKLDKYEEQFIRKIAGLIHLPPADVVRTKLRMRYLRHGDQ